MTGRAKIEAMIRETEEWRAFHAKRRNDVEALACRIRIKALKDALAAVDSRDQR